jgi:tetratricopeptide (TPR) repeat protein
MHAVEIATAATKRRVGRAADDTEKLALLSDHVRLLRTAGRARDAAEACKRALAIDAATLSIAANLAELATELVDRALAITAAKSLAPLTMDPKARAEILRDAADLALADGNRPLGAELLVKALDADPDAVVVAARLAELHASLGEWYELARTLRRALRAATTKDAIIPMASELADVARNRVKDPMLAIEALSRAREVAPDHVPTLFVLSELYIGQRSWQEALVALSDVVKSTLESTEKLVALVGRASIYRRVLERPADAERELRAALEIDPHDARAIRGLLELSATISMDERAALLSRLVVADGAPDERRRALLELAETRRALGDADGAEGALVEAAALSPDAAMFDRLRALAGNDKAAVARVLSRALARARESGRAPGVAWYLELGKVELDLDRVDAAVEHFEEALRLDATRDDARLALARALGKKGRHETAAAALAPLLDAPARPTPLDAGFVRLLEASLAGAGRQQQAWIARELRAIAGDVEPAARAELDSRRSIPPGAAMETLPASSLRSFVMPGGLGRHPIWDVAPIAMAYGSKIARIALANQGVSSRDRIKPKAVSTLRQLFDRMARAFEIVEIELAASDSVAMPVIAVEDQPWIVVPSSMADWAEPWAIAALARPFTRIALGIPWIGSIGATETLAILVAFARQVVPAFGATPIERIEPLVGDYELRAKRAIDRRRRRFLEEMEHPLSVAPAVAEDTFAEAVTRTEARAAFLLSGSLRAALDAIGTDDPALGGALRVPGPRALQAVLGRPVPRDVVSFALSGEATALRRSLGTIT